MTRKKLAILAPLKEWGGIERNMVVFCREFLAQGIAVEFILTRGGQIPYPDQFPGEVDIIDLRSGHKLDSIFKLQRHLRTSRPDALLTTKDHAAKVAILTRLFFRLDVPVYAKVTTTLSAAFRRPAKRAWARRLYPRANRLIAISQGVRADLMEHFNIAREQIEVIYNPVITPDLRDRSKHPVDHPWLQPEATTPVIMGVGRLVHGKGFHTLMEAFAQVQRKMPARLIIVGDGTERTALREQAIALGIAEAVDLPGYINDPIPWLARARLFVLSSHYEGLANVVIEALAAGTQVVATDCPYGPREILRDGKVAPLIPVGDTAAMADAITRSLEGKVETRHEEAQLERFESTQVALQYLRTMNLLPHG